MEKPDKINRQDPCMDKQLGGLKMANIFNFEKYLKIKWIEKLVKYPTLPWSYLLKESIGSLKRLTTKGGHWINNISDKDNLFLVNVMNGKNSAKSSTLLQILM